MIHQSSVEPLLAGECIASGHPIKGASGGAVRSGPGCPLDRDPASGKRSRVRSGSTRIVFSQLFGQPVGPFSMIKWARFR
jgi:hypothetical protein